MTPESLRTEHQPTEYVISSDGTRIGYRRVGAGPGLVLVQGSFGTIANFSELADLLASDFTVYLPDRRGRGLSPRPYSADHTLQRDVEDLEAILAATGAEMVFGLSSGALIALWATLSSTAITKVVAFEPMLLVNTPTTIDDLARFDRDLQREDLAAAAVTAMLASQMAPPVVRRVPYGLLKLITRLGFWIENRRGPRQYAQMRELVPALQYDFAIISQASSQVASLAGISCEVLLLSGSKSPGLLKSGVDAVLKVLPNAQHIELPGVGHGAAWNTNRRGKPQTVARALHDFFLPNPTSPEDNSW
jgi:pimeloyl-ACP methyl ester carboxylesterase